MQKVVMINRPISPIPPRKGSAGEWWMIQVAKRLRSFEPHIISTSEPGYSAYEYCDGVHYHRISMGTNYKRIFIKWLGVDLYSYAARVAKIIRSLSPAIVHAVNAHALLLDVANRLHVRPRLISHLMNEFPITSSGNVDLVITCSEYLKGFYAPRLGAGTAIQTVYMGVDIQHFKRCAENHDALVSIRKQLGIPTSAKVILFVGRVVAEKGPHLLLDAFGRLMSDGHPGYLVLVGEIRRDSKGSGDTRYLYGLRILSRCRELGDRVKVVDVVEPGTVPLYYGLADVSVVPSVFEEPFGMVNIESMAAGVPVIASNKGGIPEYLIHGVNGLLIDEHRPVEDIAEKLCLLLSDEALAKRLREAGLKTAEQRFTWERIAADTEKAYAAVLSAEQTYKESDHA